MKNKDNGGLDESIESLKKLKREMEKTLEMFSGENLDIQTTLHDEQKTAERAKKYDFTPLLDVKPGSIIRIDRGYYYHYGIYSGNNEVIHYAGSLPDKKEIIKTHIKKFLEDQDGCEFIEAEGKYSNEDSLRRATSYIGKKDYDLVFNNCEHFARWCKMGEKISLQVNKVINPIIRLVFD